MQGLEKGDAGLMASVYAEDGRVLAPGSEPVSGQAGIEQFWQGALSQGLTGGSPSTVSVEEHGDLAVEKGRSELRAGNQVVDTGKYVVVHRRQSDGSWKCRRWPTVAGRLSVGDSQPAAKQTPTATHAQRRSTVT